MKVNEISKSCYRERLGWGMEGWRERESNLAYKIVRTVKFKPRDQKWKFSIQTHPHPHMHTT